MTNNQTPKQRWQGGTYNTNCYPKGEKLYIPPMDDSLEYYFVDYYDREEVRWVRTPCQSFEEVNHIMKYIQTSGKEVSDFRVIPEKWLSELHESWDPEQAKTVVDSCTNRYWMWGGGMEAFAEQFFGVPSLNRSGISFMFESQRSETDEEWKEDRAQAIADNRAYAC